MPDPDADFLLRQEVRAYLEGILAPPQREANLYQEMRAYLEGILAPPQREANLYQEVRAYLEKTLAIANETETGSIVNYETYIASPEWAIVRDRKFRQAGYRCQLCNRRGSLVAHHRTYERLGYEREDDLVVLCNHCNSVTHAFCWSDEGRIRFTRLSPDQRRISSRRSRGKKG